MIDAAVVRELEEGERAVLVDLRADTSQMRNAVGVPNRGVVVHLVRRGRMHLGLPGDDGPDATAAHSAR